MTTSSPSQPLYPPGLVTELADRAALLDWRRVLLIWVGVIQMLYVLSLVLPLPGRSVPSLVERDFGVPAFLFVLMFLYGVGHYLRGLRPRYSLLTSLIGQAAYTVATAHYVARGEASLTILAAHGGTFGVCYLAICATAQDAASSRRRGFRFHHLLMPTLSITLALYAVGVGLQPRVAVAGWIVAHIGGAPLVALNAWLALGSGYIFHNHIRASGLYLALVSQYLYALAAVAFLATTPNVPIVAVCSHVVFAVTSGIIILIQTQEQP